MNKKNCLFFGNCQMFCIMETLKSVQLFNQQYNCFLYSTHLQKTEEDVKKLFEELKHYSVIVIQPHYSNPEYNINNIVKHTSVHCHIIIIPSSYFNYYYPNLTYLRDKNNNIIKSPSDYHDKLLIELRHLNDENIIYNTFLKHINDPYYFSSQYLDDLANKSIYELQTREMKFINEQYEHPRKYMFVSISTFIKNNYKKQLLFYSVNHPTVYLFRYICEEILKLLHINYSLKSCNIDLLNHTKWLLYESVKKNVYFDTSNYIFIINNITDLKELISKYMKSYAGHETLHSC
jgi:hypothetical protein